MRFVHTSVIAAFLALVAGTGCRKVQPFSPSRALPAGTLMFHFTQKVSGPVDLTIDGTRIPVEPAKKKVPNLVITGLPAGKHHYFISSPSDAFGPDQGDVELSPDKGTFLVNFSQHFKAVLYGEAPVVPPAEGLPGVKARMEP